MTESLKVMQKKFELTAKGLVRDQVEWAVYLGVKLSWIANLEEIRAYKGDGDPPRIVWTPEGEKGVAELFNGNQMLKLLAEEAADHMKQWGKCVKRREHYKMLAKPSQAQKKQYETDEDLSNQLFVILSVLGLFAVRLFDLGEGFKGHETLQVEIYVIITDAIYLSALRAMILHISLHNVRDAQ